MLDDPHSFLPNNGLGLNVHGQRPLNESYFKYEPQTMYSSTSNRWPQPPQPDDRASIKATIKQQDTKPLNDSYFNYDPETTLKPTNPLTQRPKPLQPKSKASKRVTSVAPTTKSKSSQPRSERARALSSAPSEALVQKIIAQESEAKDSRRLLRSALGKLDALQQRANNAEEARKEETARGVRLAQSALGIQTQVDKARLDTEVYRLQLEHMQREIRHKEEWTRSVEAERDMALKAAGKARDVARQLNDERLIALARHEGRKIGFAEGIRQGRRLAIESQTPLTAFIEEFETPRVPSAEIARKEQEAAEAARRQQEAAEAVRKEREAAEAARKEQEATDAARREREAADVLRREVEAASARAEAEATERERRRQEAAFEAEKHREALRAAERQLELERMRRKEAELEREKEAMRAQEAEMRQRDREKEQQLEKERERERALEQQLEAERQREQALERERDEERRRRVEREAELDREKEKVRELERERDMSSVSSMSQRSGPPKRLQYLPMPHPPPFKGPWPPNSNASRSVPVSAPAPAPVPTTATPSAAGVTSPLPLRVPPPNFRPPQQFQPQPHSNPRPQRRRTSQSSQETSNSGSTSINNLDIVTFPTATPFERRSHLSDIPEVSHSGASDAGRSPAASVLTGTGTGSQAVEGNARMNGANVNPEVRRGRGREREEVEQWVRSTVASEVNSDVPTEPASPPTPTQGSFRNQGRPQTRPRNSPYGDLSAHGSLSSGTIGIEVEPPTRPTSPLNNNSSTQEDLGFLSPNSRPLQLAPERPTQPQPTPQYNYQQQGPPEPPVIPDILDDSESIRHLANFTPGFVPVGFSRTNTSDASSSESERRERLERGRRERAQERNGTRIYGPPAPSSGARNAIYAQPQIRTTQFYAPSTSQQPQQNQTPRQPVSQIYAPASPAQTPRQIYAPIPPSSSSTSIGSNQPSRTNIYAPPASRPSIYANTPSAPASRPTTAIYSSPNTAPVIPLPPDRSGPVIPPPPQHPLPLPIYNTNTAGSSVPSASPHAYPYPVSGGATPGSRNAPLPGSTVGWGMHTPGGSNSYLPAPPGVGADLGWGAGAATPSSRASALPAMGINGNGGATPASRTSALPRMGIGRVGATPRAAPITLDDEEDEELDQDLQTRVNTEANRSGKGGTTLEIPARW